MRTLVVFASLAAVVCFIVYLNRRASLYYAFEDLAKRYLGLLSTTLTGNPRVTFRFRESVAQFSSHFRTPRGGGRQTRFAIAWPDLRFQLVVLRNGPRSFGVARGGLSRFSFDQPGLNEKFEVWNNDAQICRQILSPACVWHLDQLANMSRNGFLFWRIRRGKFQLSVGGHFRNKQRLHEVAAKMLDLFSQAQLSQQEGLEFVDDQAPRVIEEMVCPICSGAIGPDVVICVRCRAPHCKECWQYNGKCATFGCGADKYVMTVR